MRSTRYVAASVIMITTTMLVACSAEKHGTDVDSSQATRLLQNLSPLEKTALADKTITQGEMQQAKQAVEECLESAGFTVEDDAADPTLGGISETWTGKTGDATEDAGRSGKIDHCMSIADAINAVWVLQHQKSKEEVDAVENAFVKCARSAGLALKSGASFQEAGQAARTALNSVRQESTDTKAQALMDCEQRLATDEGALAPAGLQHELSKLDMKAQ